MSSKDDDSRPGSPQIDEDEDTITMLDVLEDENKLQEEASAVLGNSDEKNCTYSKGYIPRQALYSCATCSDGSDNVAAICLACSLECHENHQLYELYTKRNFRCDCGNSKFKEGFECKLEKFKLPLNENNKYNHNFSGKYCICDTAYPPDENENTTQEDMWQCVACEDWYHSNHLATENIPEKFEEFVCGQCATKLNFLYSYAKEDTTTTTSATDGNNTDSKCQDQINECCLLNKTKQLGDIEQKGPIFFPSSVYRKKLCRCSECMELYKEKECTYLIDETDTVSHYEAQGKANNSNLSQYEQGMSALGRMNRVAVVEALHGYNTLKADLSDYLRKFAEGKKIVREEDIHEFFDQMKQKKRKLE